MKKTLSLVLISQFFTLFSYAQLINGSFKFDGLDRTYSVYLPTSFQPEEPLPLLLALHGYTQNGATMMAFSGFNAIADTGNFIVAYPNGISNSWNVGLSGGSNADDVGFLLALVDTLHHQFNIDYRRVYSTGFSNGGFMSYKLACEVPNSFAAIAPVSGTMTEASFAACRPTLAVPVLHIHGTLDYVVSYTGSFGNLSAEAAVGLWTGFNNCPATPVIENLPDLVAEGSTVQRYTWAPCDGGSEVELLKIISGGHTWPGSVGVTGIGITNRDIVASSEIWNFVKCFTRDEATAIFQKETSSLRIYPNPMHGNQITLSTAKSFRNLKVQIMEISGRLVFSKQIDEASSAFSLYLPDIAPGCYVVVLKGDNLVETQKLLVY